MDLFIKGNDDLNLYVEHVGVFKKSQFKTKSYYIINYISRGEGFFSTDYDSIPAFEGDVFIINPNFPHKFNASEQHTYMGMYCCYFEPQIINSEYKNYYRYFPQISDFLKGNSGYLHTHDTDLKEIRSIIIKIINEHVAHQAGYSINISSYLSILITLIFRNYKLNDKKNNSHVFSQNHIVDATIQDINASLFDGITLNKLAEIRHVSPSYLCRLFKKHTGMTTTDFINNLKIEKLKDILQNTDRPISLILESINNSPEHIKRLFKKETGMSFTEYRKKYYDI